MKLFLFLLTITSTICILSCSKNDYSEASKYAFKYGNGYYLSDVISFDHKKMNKDTVFDNEKSEFIIKYFGKPLFQSHYILEIESIKTQEVGRYHAKWLKSQFEEKNKP